jgi:hypothetical protein
VKFAVATKANGREQMRERQRRDRAATPTLRARFPQFEQLRIDLEFSDDGPFTPAPQVNVLHPPARAYFAFPCPYADCNGEFDLSGPVDALAHAGQVRSAGKMSCEGQRHRNLDGRSPCKLALDYTITAQAE